MGRGLLIGALIWGLVAGFAAPARADFADGVAAMERGDGRAALSEFRPLAERGHAQAQHKLGLMYRAGVGVPRDAAAAVDWISRAAEQGDALAQYDLGLMYATGQGVAQDYVLAHLWFHLSAGQRQDIYRVSRRAARNRGLVAAEMTPAELAKAQRLAHQWLEDHPATP